MKKTSSNIKSLRQLFKEKGLEIINGNAVTDANEAFPVLDLDQEFPVIMLKKTAYNPGRAGKELVRSAYVEHLRTLLPESKKLLNKNNVLENNDTATGTEGDIIMDESYKRLIDRLDQDIRDHKQEVRDRDLKLYHDMKEREERFLKHVDDLFLSQKEVLELKFSKLDENIVNIRTELSAQTQRIDNIHSRVDSLKYFIIGSLIGVAGIVYANWQVIGAMLQLAKDK